MTNTGYQLLKLCKATGLHFDVCYEDDVEAAADYTAPLNLLWSEATACDSATVRFEDDSWVHLIHYNDPDETISDYSLGGMAAKAVEAMEGGAS